MGVEGLVLTAKICLYSRWLIETAEPIEADALQQFPLTLEALEAYAVRARNAADGISMPHQIAMLIDYRRALDIIREGREAPDKVACKPALSSPPATPG